MKVRAYIHPQLNILCCALHPEAVPQGVEAIEFDVESTDDIIYDGIRIRLKTEAEKLAEAKQKAINELSQKTETYILKYYSENKQRSDVSDKENGENFLIYKGLDVTALRKDITELIMQHYPDFTITLQLLLGKYTSDNQYVNYWLEQLLKVAFRSYFVFLVKQEHNFIKQAIENAKSIEELPRIEFNISYPEV